MWKNWLTLSGSPSPEREFILVNATRTNRDCEDKSPGRPSAPIPRLYRFRESPFAKVFSGDFADRPIVLHFWASWNEQCREDLQVFEEAYQEYGQQVEFLMINMTDGSKETMETASAFLDRVQYSFPVYFDLDKSAYETIPVRSIPSTYYIDRDFQMVARATGGTNAEETLEEGLQMLLDDVM